MRKYFLGFSILSLTMSVYSQTGTPSKEIQAKKAPVKEEPAKDIPGKEMPVKKVNLTLVVKMPERNEKGEKWDLTSGANQRISITGADCKAVKKENKGLNVTWDCSSITLDKDDQFQIRIFEKDLIKNDKVGTGIVSASKKGEQIVGVATVEVTAK